MALVGDQVIVTDGRESPHPVRVALELGRTGPAHAGSGGLLLLSRMTADQVCALYPDEALEAVTPATLTSRTALLDELAVIRRRGHAISRGASVPGMTTVAVPLAGSSWRDRLALVAAAPATAPAKRRSPNGRNGYGSQRRCWHPYRRPDPARPGAYAALSAVLRRSAPPAAPATH
ncbi:hypothetical protein LUR56_25880 [Streptomyces sp. MT29]|nr:hypothetical protein [Streptomyces sp. MT29]